MARKHNLKRNRVSQPVERTLIKEAETARSIKLNPASGQYEVVLTIVKPAVYKQGQPSASTLKGRGKPNATDVKGGKK